MTTTGTVIESTEIATQTAIVVFAKPGEILGPNTEYDKRRVAMLKKHSETLAAAAGVTIVDNATQLEWAVEVGRSLQSNIKEAEAFFKPIKAQIDELKRPVLESERRDTAPLETEKTRVGRLITVFQRREQERVEREEREARAAAEAAARNNQIQAAIDLEASGDLHQAEAVLEEEAVPVAFVAPKVAHVAGQIGKKTYAAEVVNLMELVKAVANGAAPIQALQADQSFLNKQANSYREGFRMPGCKLVTEAKTHFRR